MIPNGKFTITNKSTGEHRTFQVKTQPKDSKFMQGRRIVALLSGSDNENDYQGFGHLGFEGRIVHLWKRKDTPAFRYFAQLIELMGEKIQKDSEDFSGEIEYLKGNVYQFSGSKRCLVCNRTLTDPESIRLQIGPVCRGMVA